uniref:sortilin-related receptor isoform X3 n=1 Tax=Myxine glutinosa TaxID=7769 RepID=UPI00358EC55C
MSVSLYVCFLLSGVLCDSLGAANNLHVHLPRDSSINHQHWNIYVPQADESGGSPHDLRRNRVRRDAELPPSPHVTTAILHDNHSQLVVHWAGEGSDVIIALARNPPGNQKSSSALYMSYDYGKNYSNIQKKFSDLPNGTVTVISQFYHSPMDNKRYIFADSEHSFLWRTTDYGRTVTPCPCPFRPSDLLLHGRQPQLLLGYDSTSKQLWKSDNFGETWMLIQEKVKAYFWGEVPYDDPTTIYVTREEPGGMTTVLRSNDYFQDSTKLHVVLERADRFEIRGPYLFATKTVKLLGSAFPNSVQLWTSFERSPMRAADFHTRRRITELIVVDAEEDAVMVCVIHGPGDANLYVSDRRSLSFSRSLDNVLHYNPHGVLFTRLLGDEAFADVHRVAGLSGVYLASQVFRDNRTYHLQGNGLEYPLKKRSLVSFDKGGTWEVLQAPAMDAYGRPLHCSENCSLHITQKYGRLESVGRRLSPVLTKASAPGLIVASGSVGEFLSNKPNVYISTNAGVKWRETLQGPHDFAFGDHGGIIVAIRQNGTTKSIRYSVDEGGTWQEMALSSEPLTIYGILTEPGERTAVFTIFGSISEETHSWLIFQVNLTHVLGPPCSDVDYKDWSPADEKGISCLLGRKMVYRRRTPHAKCYNGRNYDRPIHSINCSCSRLDFECDEGYRLLVASEHCVRDPDFDGDPTLPPASCNHTYQRTRGYRKVSGDTCSGGDVERSLSPEAVSCPVQEIREFILFSRRSSIKRYDLATGHLETLPLASLHSVSALDFNYRTNCLYWADLGYNSIQRVCLNGSTEQQIVHGKLKGVEGLALDPSSSLLYWVNSQAPTIEVSRLDGSQRKVLLNSSFLERPRSLALVPQQGLLFWTDWGEHAAISRATMAGSNPVHVVSTNLRWPNGVAVDGDRIYWTDAFFDRIESAKLNGDDRVVLLWQGVPHPYAIAVYKKYMYWGDWERESIFTASKMDGSGIRVLLQRLGNILDLKVYHQGSQNGLSACSVSNGNCSHLCLPSGPSQRICTCPDNSTPGLPQDSGDVLCDGSAHDTGCGANYRCDNGHCINPLWRCDGENDCWDGSDENNCDTTCGPDQLRCVLMGHCISNDLRCNGNDDCGDGSDEPNSCPRTACNSHQFSCANGRCISPTWKCDGEDDCRDGSDERNCPTKDPERSCSPSSFFCPAGQCIPVSWKCDGDQDCYGGEDEKDCGEVCQENEFRCSSGHCILYSWHCDGDADCPDDSDETNCMTTPNTALTSTTPSSTTCSTHEFRCMGGGCVSLRWRCDGINDCGDYSDEAECSGLTHAPSLCYPLFQIQCGNGRCVLSWWRCDGDNDCGDWTDEKDCPGEASPTSYTPCPSDRFTCADGSCILSELVCDYGQDCADGSDEANCTTQGPQHPDSMLCSLSEFMCTSDDRCLPAKQRCDGRTDCADASDEAGCSFVCGPNQVACTGMAGCISATQRCDGFHDCPDGSDEKSCPDFKNFPVRSLKSSVSVDGNITVEWEPPKPAPHEFVYIVHVTQIAGGSQLSAQVPAGKTSWHCSSLRSATRYMVTVSVKTSVLQYNATTSIVLITPEGLPTVPRTLNVSFLSLESDPAFRLSWLPPASTNGLIRFYVVSIQTSGSSVVDKITNERTFTLSFNPNEDYSLRVAAATSYGQGPWTDWVHVFANTTAWENVPQNVKILDVSNNSFTVSWKPGSPRPQNYNVSLKWAFEGFQEEMKFFSVAGTENSFKVTEIAGGQEYTVSLAMDMGHGSTSFWSPEVLLQLPGPAPQMPFLNYPKAINSTTMLCSWKGDGEEFGLYSGQNEQSMWEKGPRIQTANHNATITVPLHEISIFMVRVLKPFIGPPSNLAIRSTVEYDVAPYGLHSPRLSETSVTLKWSPAYGASQNLKNYTVWVKPNDNDAVSGTRAYHVSSKDLSVSTTIHGLSPGEEYDAWVSVANGSIKSNSLHFATDPLAAPRAVKVVPLGVKEVMIIWKDLALSDKNFNRSRGYVVNVTSLEWKKSPYVIQTMETHVLWTIAEPGQMYLFNVRAACRRGNTCSLAATTSFQAAHEEEKWDNALVVIPVIVIIVLLTFAAFITCLILRRRFGFTRLVIDANSHYNSRNGSATLYLGDDEDDDVPIQGFSDDEPLVIA